MPAEWEPHDATWVAWPSHEDLWQRNLAPARAAFARMVGAIAGGETVEVLVPDAAQEALARAALPDQNVRFHRIPFGDIWLRDTAPVFLRGPAGELGAATFRFNGWGGKYVLEHDDRVSGRIAGACAAARAFAMPFVLEGGAVDLDGEGRVLTTRQCLLDPNRNGPVDAATVEGWLRDALGVTEVLWLGDGLLNDHTDGHVDTVVRFVRPGVVLAMEPRSGDDPNAAALRALIREASSHRLEVARIPSPGRVLDAEGRIMPASYANFYIANSCVVVPTYGSPWDDEAVEGIGALFPGRRVLGIDARAVLTGGGAFHCITQQQPGARR
ncbi:MAG TPA: agmatine deiminase family protein [Polyangiaceae bacterium]|jgi:agmatine deiminase